MSERVRSTLRGRVLELFERARRAINLDTLTDLLTQPVAQVVEALTSTWARVVGSGLRADVEPLVRQIAREAGGQAQGMESATALWAATHVGDVAGQVIRTTEAATLASVQRVSQPLLLTRPDGTSFVVEPLPPLEASRSLKRQLGLTTTQTRSLEALRQGLLVEGVSLAHLERTLERKAAQGLRERARLIAETTAHTAKEAGAQLDQEAAVRAGLAAPDAIRRFWRLGTLDRVCPVCRPIPALNPEGRGLLEPFQTPVGPILIPTVHPRCRCTLEHRRVA